MNAQDKIDQSGPAHSQKSEAELRVELAALYRIFDMYGWDELIYNHMSVRVPGEPDQMLLNAWGLGFDEITASNLLKVNFAGEVIGEKGAFGPNIAGVVLHGGILEAREDINAVIHHHSVAATAVASQEHGLLPLSIQAVMNWDLIAYHDFEGIVLDPGEKIRMNAALGKDKKILILRNHGVVTAGATLQEAFMLAYWLEKACQVQIAALSGGAQHLISEELQELVPQQNKPGKGMLWQTGVREFEALMRKIDRIDPGYRD